MAGRGRPKKPTQLKILEGNPGKRATDGSEPVATGAPERPRGLTGDAKWMWDFAEPQLRAMGVAKLVDSPALRAMCELWQLYRAAFKAAKKNPLGRDARIAVSIYYAKWSAAASQFGLDPASRSKIELEADAGDTNPLKEFGIVG